MTNTDLSARLVARIISRHVRPNMVEFQGARSVGLGMNGIEEAAQEIISLINPDGSEAAARIKALEDDNADLRVRVSRWEPKPVSLSGSTILTGDQARASIPDTGEG